MLSQEEKAPSIDEWIAQAKADAGAAGVGMYLVHDGVVRETARSRVREGKEDAAPVAGMYFSYNREKVEQAISRTHQMPGISFIRVWLAKGELKVGDDIMRVLIGGDIRPHVIDALQSLVGCIKNECVEEKEIYG